MAIKFGSNAQKWAYFFKLSTTITIEFPLDKGNPTIKHIVMSSHALDGIGSGCSNPTGACVENLVCWQIIQHSAEAFTSSYIFGQ